jgi:hypothetical protein
MTLSNPEILQLYVNYLDEATNTVDYERLYRDLKNGIKEEGDFDFCLYQEGKQRKKKGSPSLTYEEIITSLHARIASKIDCLVGRDYLKKIYLLLSESRSASVTRAQLKSACHHRLSLFFRDQDVEVIFQKLDVNNEGAVNTTSLIKEIMKREKKHEVTLLIGDSHSNTKRVAIDHNANEAARITYDNKFLNLTVRAVLPSYSQPCPPTIP